MTRAMATALLVVDVQNDFLPGGALPVPQGDAVVPPIARLCERFETVVASQDWHPPGHVSFASSHPGHQPFETIVLADGTEQTLWPEHCVQGTEGARFAPGLPVHRFAHVVRKGTDPEVDSYSAFFDNARRRQTGLHAWLQERGIGRLYVCGLATDYCVRATALDAVSLGYETWLVTDAVRGVAPQSTERALQQMAEAGVRRALSASLLAG